MRLGNILASDLISDNTIIYLSFPFEESNKRVKGKWSDEDVIKYIEFEVNYTCYYPKQDVMMVYLGQIR